MASKTDFIESLPQKIKSKLNLDFNFTHIDCIDGYLFLWGEGYSHQIVRAHLDTEDLYLINIRENIKIHSVRLLSRNNRQYLLISENRHRSQVHVISVANPEEQLTIQNFSRILQMEHSSISSSTIYVLDTNHFHIIGLQKNCKSIVHHDRIDVSSHNFVLFTMGTPKHLHDKLLAEYNVYHGFSKCAAYFSTADGDMYVCSPIIPHNFQCRMRSLEVFGADFIQNNGNISNSPNSSDDFKDELVEEDDLFGLWVEQCWTTSILSEQTSHLMNASLLNETQSFMAKQEQNAFATFDATKTFVHQNQAMHRQFYKLNIHDTNNKVRRGMDTVQCTRLVLLDVDSFFFADGRLTKNAAADVRDDLHQDNEPELSVHIPPVFVRLWSDHSVDIVCCTKPIHCSWSLPYNQRKIRSPQHFDGIIICRNYLDFDVKNDIPFVAQTVQNLDELVLAHHIEGIYRFKMQWLREIPFALHENTYFELLRQSESSMEHVPMFEFYSNGFGADTAFLADVCILNHVDHESDDSLILLDSNLKASLKALRVMALYTADPVDHSLEITKKSPVKAVTLGVSGMGTQSAMDIAKPFDTTQIENVRRNVHQLMAKMKQLPPDFSLSNLKSLQWFMDLKMKIEKQVFEPVEIGHLAMNERRLFIEDQMEQYVQPQIQVMEGKVQGIGSMNKQLRGKAEEILDNQRDLERRIERLKNMKGVPQMGDEKLVALELVLKDYEKAVKAVEFDFKQFEQFKVNHEGFVIDGDGEHLEAQMKRLCKNSDSMLKEMKKGINEVLQTHSLD